MARRRETGPTRSTARPFPSNTRHFSRTWHTTRPHALDEKVAINGVVRTTAGTKRAWAVKLALHTVRVGA
jgi:hypothetical protein